MENIQLKNGLKEFSIDDLIKDQEKYKLPPMQRDAVWKEDRIEMLWDSILRRFPIGIFICAEIDEIPEDIRATNFQESRNHPGPKGFSDLQVGDFLVIDGQQRLNAIRAAFLRDNPYIKVWFDLSSPNLDEEEKEIKYRFFVCTDSNPWGLGVTASAQQSASEKIGWLDDIKSPSLDKTWPIKAILPVPFSEFVDYIRKNTPNIPLSFDALKHLFPKEINPEPENLRTDIEEVLQTINDVVLSESTKNIPFVILNKYDKFSLGKIYDRLNTGGVPPSRADMFFSSLKLYWQDSRLLVNQIYEDLGTGRFLEPIEIVRLAVRTVAPKVTTLDVKKFDVFIKENEEDLKALLLRGNSGKSELHQCLYLARAALEYRYKSPDDPGLPAALLAELSPRVWHTLVYWIYHHHGTVSEGDRMEMLRYACFDLFYHMPQMRNTLENLPFLKTEDDKDIFGLKDAAIFPGTEIYERICKYYTEGSRGINDNNYNDLLMRPNEYEGKLIEDPASPTGDILANEINLVLWSQRMSLHKWFEEDKQGSSDNFYWSPTARIYDIDHILPASYLNFRNGRGYNWYNKCYKGFRPNWIRSTVVNSVGNKRALPSTINRAIQSQNLDEKFLLGNADEPITDKNYHQKGLKTIGDVRKYSAFPDDEKSLKRWKTAAAIKVREKIDPRDWGNQKRFEAFYEATRQRRISMYTMLFEAIRWDTWLHKMGGDDNSND